MDIDEVIERAGPRQFGPSDDMPEEYRNAATRMIQFHANSEVMGGYLDTVFTRKAPSLDRKLAASAKCQDEIGHAQLLYRAAETLGVKSRDQMLAELANGEGKFLNCFHYQVDSWYEAPMIDFFVDGAAMRRQATLKRTSWEPYAHAMDKVCFEEGFHVKHGEDILRELMSSSKKNRERTQETFEEWWPRILQFFGPTNDQSTHHDFASRVGLKTMTNDELRTAFLNAYMPKARKHGLEIPDTPRIRERDDGTYEVVEDDLNWDEFWTIAKNESEGSHEQIGSRRRRQEAVAWVRDALDASETTRRGHDPAGGRLTMIFEVFRQEKPGDSHRHVGNVHAPDREMAKLFAQVQHGRRMQTNSLWVVPQDDVSEVDTDDTSFGGRTDKAYRWAMTYNRVDASFAEEVADSEDEQREVAKKRQEADS